MRVLGAISVALQGVCAGWLLASGDVALGVLAAAMSALYAFEDSPWE